jgi:hypothetical protein
MNRNGQASKTAGPVDLTIPPNDNPVCLPPLQAKATIALEKRFEPQFQRRSLVVPVDETTAGNHWSQSFDAHFWRSAAQVFLVSGTRFRDIPAMYPKATFVQRQLAY